MDNTDKKQKPLLSQNIIARRKALGLTAQDLAEKARIPYPTLRDIEAGASGGQLATRIEIARALGCDETDLHQKPASTQPLATFSEAQMSEIKALVQEAIRQTNSMPGTLGEIVTVLKGQPESLLVEVLRWVKDRVAFEVSAPQKKSKTR